MRNHKLQVESRKSARAFTLVECLIGLAISALLLAAVAVAFNASVVSYSENEDMFWTINNARQALARMTSQLRMAGYEDPTFGLIAANPSDPNNRCSFRTADGGDFTYEFRSADNRLYYINNATSQEYVLCNHVVDARFMKTTTSDGMDCKSVQISLTVQSGDTRKTLSAAAVIRRTLNL